MIYNRADQSITSELIGTEPHKEPNVNERTVLTVSPIKPEETVANHYLIEHQGVKMSKLGQFKFNIERILMAIKFAQFEKESA